MGEPFSVKLGEVADIVMGQSPAGDTCNRNGVGDPLLNGPTEFGSHHPFPTQFTTDAKKFSKPGDVLFCVRGSTTGRMNWSDREYAIGRGIAAIRHKRNTGIQPLIRSIIEYHLPTLLQAATGSTFPNVSARQLAEIPYAAISEGEQLAIASLFGALDDKIELNRQTNETLEAMARALFKDWFVDFGPTRAKMVGHAPYLAPDLWSLFPDRLDEETGLPEGWVESPMGDLGEITIGGLWGNDDAAGGDHVSFKCLRGVDLQHLRESGAAPKVPERFASLEGITKRAIETTDVLIASSGAGPCGRSLWVGLDQFFRQDGPTIYSNFVKRIRCKSPEHACFLDRHLHEMKVSGEIEKFITGTSVPNLNDKGLMQAQRVVVPDFVLLQAFHDFCIVLQKRLFSKENVILAQTRDLLLPKLMSAEIRLRDAEQVAGVVP